MHTKVEGLNNQERILGIYEKELLAVIQALDTWKHYLLGTPFVLRTDRQSLCYFMMQTKLSDKQMRWANFLSQFHFHIARKTEPYIRYLIKKAKNKCCHYCLS